LKVWLKADAITGLNDGDAVGTWSDQSGNGYDATQPTSAKRPIYKTGILNGKPVVRFDGVDDQLDFLGAALDIFKNVGSGNLIVVCSDTNNTGGRVSHDPVAFVTGDGSTFARISIETRTSSTSIFWHRARRVDGDPGVSATFAYSNGFHVLIAEAKPETNFAQLYVDGTAGTSTTYAGGAGNFSNTSSAGVSGASGASVGCSGGGGGNFFPGDIAEVLVFQPALSAADRNAIYNYLAIKYGFATVSQGDSLNSAEAVTAVKGAAALSRTTTE